MKPANVFRPLGVDHIQFVCYDRRFWQKQLERFGFRTFENPSTHLWKVSTLAHGNVRVVLIDPESNGYLVPGGAEKFLRARGDMQVLGAAILVNSGEAVARELKERHIPYGGGVSHMPRNMEDPFGEYICRISLEHKDKSTRWELVERSRNVHRGSRSSWKSRGVDHFAIGVENLERWEAWYHSLGFETIYAPPHDRIRGEHSGMKTVAVQRGGWVVALVEGVDRDLPSQVTTYVDAHGDHAIQHAAIRFSDLHATLAVLKERRNVQFRFRRDPLDPANPVIDDILHVGRDHGGPLLQCFTKPLARRNGKAGFFFELIQRVASFDEVKRGDGEAFDTRTVKGLYQGIEDEELARDTGLVFPDDAMKDYRFSEWLAQHKKEA